MGYICPECDKSAESNVIQCNTCEYWFHYSCSKLSVHYLFLLIQEKRIPYYCELCVHQKYKKEYPLQHVSLEKIIDSQSFSNRAMPNQTNDSFEIENDDKTDVPPTRVGVKYSTCTWYLYLSTYLSVLAVLEYLVYGNVKVLVLVLVLDQKVLGTYK